MGSGDTLLNSGISIMSMSLGFLIAELTFATPDGMIYIGTVAAAGLMLIAIGLIYNYIEKKKRWK